MLLGADHLRQEREVWLFQTEEPARRPYTLLHLSSHGLLLQLDVRQAFLAGALASVIVMAQTVIEATLVAMLVIGRV